MPHIDHATVEQSNVVFQSSLTILTKLYLKSLWGMSDQTQCTIKCIWGSMFLIVNFCKLLVCPTLNSFNCRWSWPWQFWSMPYYGRVSLWMHRGSNCHWSKFPRGKFCHFFPPLKWSLCILKRQINGINIFFQQMPVIIAGNEQQQKKYLGRMTEEPMMCVSITATL